MNFLWRRSARDNSKPTPAQAGQTRDGQGARHRFIAVSQDWRTTFTTLGHRHPICRAMASGLRLGLGNPPTDAAPVGMRELV